MAEQVTRRRFLGTGAVAAAALAGPVGALAQAELASSTTAIYRLRTGCGSRRCVCMSCIKWDKHAFFPTKKAADGNRAHIGCNCVIQKGTIHTATYRKLFGTRADRTHYFVDSRWSWVRHLIRQDPPKFS